MLRACLSERPEYRKRSRKVYTNGNRWETSQRRAHLFFYGGRGKTLSSLLSRPLSLRHLSILSSVAIANAITNNCISNRWRSCCCCRQLGATEELARNHRTTTKPQHRHHGQKSMTSFSKLYLYTHIYFHPNYISFHAVRQNSQLLPLDIKINTGHLVVRNALK